MLDSEPQRMVELSRPPLGRRVFRLQQRRLFPPGAWRPVLGVPTALGARSGRESIVAFGFLLYIFGRRNGTRPAEERSGAPGVPIRIHRFFTGLS